MTIRLAFCSVNELPSDLRRLAESLPFGEDDRKRLRALSHEDALRHSLAARLALLSLYPNSGEIIREADGKPRFSELGAPYFSLSHAGGLAVAALSDEAPIGADLEAERASLNERAIAARFFTEAERSELQRGGDFLSLWTKKEARAKCLGLPLAEALRNDFPLPTKTYRSSGFTLSLAAEQEFSVTWQNSDDTIHLQEIF